MISPTQTHPGPQYSKIYFKRDSAGISINIVQFAKITVKPMGMLGQNLDTLVKFVGKQRYVPRGSLDIGDWIIVTTRNSVYKIRKLEKNLFQISGGWFTIHGISPITLSIRGCTWGGSAIKTDILAACGLCLEFGNNVTTSPIQRVVCIKFNNRN